MTRGVVVRSFQCALAMGMALALFSCSGGGSSSPAVRSPIVSGGSAATSAVFTIQVPRATSASSTSRSRKPQYVSASTQSIAIATNGQTPVVANLTPTSPGCVAATPSIPLTCTIAQPATVGADTFTLTLYDGLSAAGNILSTATVHQTIAFGHTNTIKVTLNGVVSSLQLSLSTPNPPIGSAATIALDVSALDADGNIIIAPGNYVNAGGGALPIVLSDSDKSGITKLTGTKLSSPSSTAATLSYNGSPLPAGVTITASATGVSPVTALFAPRTPGATKIYVTNNLGNGTGTVTTYNADGSASTPTITGLNNPVGVAVDAAGKIYAAGQCGAYCTNVSGTMTTYNADGSASTPTITGLNFPLGVAVDAAGKIYVTNVCGLPQCGPSSGSIATYNADGSASTPTITGLNSPQGVAVDAAGKIYVTGVGNGTGTVTTWNADGSASTPTITGLNNPFGVAVDAAGKIYVASICGNPCQSNTGSVTTYSADGSASTPTITGLNDPYGVAVDAAGKLYVTSFPNTIGAVSTYNPDGSASTPTITGLPSPLGIAVH